VYPSGSRSWNRDEGNHFLTAKERGTKTQERCRLGKYQFHYVGDCQEWNSLKGKMPHHELHASSGEMNNDALLGRCKEKNQRLLFDGINNSIVGRNDVTASASQAMQEEEKHSNS
jgi:hypothetical protein